MDIPNKLISSSETRDTVRTWQSQGLKVVFSNGCFDILHAGHVRYLTEARKLGDRLVIGLNSDSSVRSIKGPDRPVCCEADRAEVLSALEVVDAVVLFEEDTPRALIELLLPDILVKGSDWKISDIAGAEAVLGHGGKVLTLPLLEGRSTTGIIEKIIRACSHSEGSCETH